jgi:hypothetical protein
MIELLLGPHRREAPSLTLARFWLGTAEQDRTPRAEIWCPTTVSDAAWRGRDGGAKGDNEIGARSADRRKQMAVGCIQRLGCTWRRMVTA